MTKVTGSLCRLRWADARGLARPFSSNLVAFGSRVGASAASSGGSLGGTAVLARVPGLVTNVAARPVRRATASWRATDSSRFPVCGDVAAGSSPECVSSGRIPTWGCTGPAQPVAAGPHPWEPTDTRTCYWGRPVTVAAARTHRGDPADSRPASTWYARAAQPVAASRPRWYTFCLPGRPDGPDTSTCAHHAVPRSVAVAVLPCWCAHDAVRRSGRCSGTYDAVPDPRWYGRRSGTHDAVPFSTVDADAVAAACDPRAGDTVSYAWWPADGMAAVT